MSNKIRFSDYQFRASTLFKSITITGACLTALFTFLLWVGDMRYAKKEQVTIMAAQVAFMHRMFVEAGRPKDSK